MFEPRQSKNRVITLCLILFLLFTNTFGQSRNQNEAAGQSAKVPGRGKISLPDKIGNNWRSIVPSHTLSAHQFSVLPDGDVYNEYGLQSLTTRFYTNGKTKCWVELFQTRYVSEAYGLFTFIRTYRTDKHLAFYSGRLLLIISGESGDMPLGQLFIDSIKGSINSYEYEGDLPSLPFNLPEEHKIRNTEKYLIGPITLGRIKEFADFKDVVSFAGGTQAAIANYENAGGQMSLIVFEYHTPQLATDGYTQTQNYFENLSKSEKSSRLLRRIGNYIVVAANIQDITGAESVIGQIKYSPKIYWEGKKITDVPVQFRPPDSLAIEEASQTANMIIRTFYWIGIMILVAIVMGFVAGSSFFYWNRYRRRKLGIDDVFSDAGGTVRLNLDDYLLEPESSSAKIITEGKKPDGK